MSTFIVSSAERCFEKLYLDHETADARFKIKVGNEFEYFPAHKIILSAASEVFRAMFYGPIKEKGDILIVDASPVAFKAFLEFFYKPKVALPSTDILNVINLCKKYEMPMETKACEEAIKCFATDDDICSVYAMAVFFELDDLIQFCESRIITKANSICSSAGFLECDRITFGKVIRLTAFSYNFNASQKVDACMAWAKAECTRKNLIHTSANLKGQIKDVIGRIPFDELTIDGFKQFTAKYVDFFDTSDYHSIVLKLMT